MRISTWKPVTRPSSTTLVNPRVWMTLYSSTGSVPLGGELGGDVAGPTDGEGDRGEGRVAGDGCGDDPVPGDVEPVDAPDPRRRRAHRRPVVGRPHADGALVVQGRTWREGEWLIAQRVTERLGDASDGRAGGLDRGVVAFGEPVVDLHRRHAVRVDFAVVECDAVGLLQVLGAE